mgnify:CR=1 FL=1
MNSEKGLIFIGANDMREIKDYVKQSKYGYFIEPIPETFKILESNLKKCNETYGTNYIPLNYLITNVDNKIYEFNIYGENRKKKETPYGNNGASSSILTKNDKFFWKNCDCNKKIQIKSIRMNTLLNNLNIDIKEFPNLIVDTQGGELEVFKSFDDKLNDINFIKTEVSLVPYYHGGVLFPELNKYLNNYNLYTKDKPSIHCNITYLRK